MIRSQEEIVERVRTREKRDPLGLADVDLLEWLDYEHAREFLKPDVTKEAWEANPPPTPLRDQMVEYMPFAWKKANGCRGLSAWRSMVHYANWLWLIGEDALADQLASGHTHYGKENLILVCQHLKLDPAQWDDGKRVDSD